MIKIEDVVDFVKEYGETEVSREDIEKSVLGHLKYNTCTILIDKKGISVVCGWNVFGKIASVTRLVIRPDLRNQGIMAYIALIAIGKFPSLEYLKFSREKYPSKGSKIIRIDSIFRKGLNYGKQTTRNSAACY